MKPSTSNNVGSLVTFAIIGVIYLFFAWNTPAVLGFRYNVPRSEVHVENEPHDCDFIRAPLGDKECSYERQITVIKTGSDTAGHHFVTYNEGKTWSPIEDPDQVQTGVFVTWRREPH